MSEMILTRCPAAEEAGIGQRLTAPRGPRQGIGLGRKDVAISIAKTQRLNRIAFQASPAHHAVIDHRGWGGQTYPTGLGDAAKTKRIGLGCFPAGFDRLSRQAQCHGCHCDADAAKRLPRCGVGRLRAGRLRCSADPGIVRRRLTRYQHDPIGR